MSDFEIIDEINISRCFDEKTIDIDKNKMDDSSESEIVSDSETSSESDVEHEEITYRFLRSKSKTNEFDSFLDLFYPVFFICSVGILSLCFVN